MDTASLPRESVDRALARRAEIASVTSYRIGPCIKTLIAVSPDSLETFADVRIDKTRDAAIIDAALAAIVASRPEAAGDPIDARYGLVFASEDGQRILSVYKGRFASAGQIDARPVSYADQALHDWLTARFPFE